MGCLPSSESTDMALAGDDTSRGKSAIARARQLNRGDDLAGAGLLAVIRRCRGSILTCGGEGGGAVLQPLLTLFFSSYRGPPFQELEEIAQLARLSHPR
ncbi:MAG TPA: hypothetical protein EYN92_00365 [Dehalococcoidia bacterium]|nr:hypothetical protein [Dehalococcoidia bacterium]